MELRIFVIYYDIFDWKRQVWVYNLIPNLKILNPSSLRAQMELYFGTYTSCLEERGYKGGLQPTSLKPEYK